MKKMLVILLFLMLLSLAAGTLAEQTGSAPEEATAAAEPAAPEEDPLPEEEEIPEQSALAQALSAYRALKEAGRVQDLDDLKAELDAFVADGKLTREQADLVLQYFTDCFAFRGGRGRNGKNQADAGNSGLNQNGQQIRNRRRQGQDAQSDNGNNARNGKGQGNSNRNGRGQSGGRGYRQAGPRTDTGSPAEGNADTDTVSGATQKGNKQGNK